MLPFISTFVRKVRFSSVMSHIPPTSRTTLPFPIVLNTKMCIYVLTRVKPCMDVLNMSKGTLIGFSLLIAGILIWIAYGLYLGFEEIMQALDLVTGFVIGLIIIGLLVLFASIILEQRKDTKKIKEEISKEDLEP